MKANFIKLSLLFLALSACKVISFFPLYSPEVVVERKSIQGKYEVDDDVAVYIFKQAELWKAFQEKEVDPTKEYMLPNGMKIPPFIASMLQDQVHAPELDKEENTEEDRQHSLPYFKSGYIVVEDRLSSDPLPTEMEFDEDQIINLLSRFGMYRMVFLELEGQLYADVCAFQENIGFNLSADDDFIPVHSFAKCEMLEDGFKLEFLSEEYLENLFAENRIRLPHLKRSDAGEKRILLTASPAELQKFMIKFGGDKKAFDAVKRYQRSNG